MKKVFIPSYGGGHANIMKLLYPELKNRFDVEILALTLADDVYTKANIPHKTIKDYLSTFTEEDQENILDHGQELAKTEYNPQSSMQYEDCVVYLGMGMVDLIRQLQSFEKAEAEFKEKGRKAFCPFNVAKHILQHVQPNIVVVSVNVRFEAAVGIAANELNIPVLFIQDIPDVYMLPFRADVCVMNDYTKQIYTKANQKNVENIFVTGQPVFDQIFNIKDSDIAAVQQYFKLDSTTKLIVYLEQPGLNYTKDVENFLKQEAKLRPNNVYVIKLHPNMLLDDEVLSTTGNCIKIRDINLLALLANTDIVITQDSTAGLEAALLGIDMIVTDFDSEFASLDFASLGLALRAKSLTELADCLKNLLSNSDENHQLNESRQSFKSYPNAAVNISNVIKRIVE